MIVHGFPGEGKRWEGKGCFRKADLQTFFTVKQDIHKGLWYTVFTTR